MDKSNGYERIATIYIDGRGRATEGIGSSTVRNWVKILTPHSYVLDIGCGTGMPISRIFIEAGMNIYALDASPTMVKTFKKNFPTIPVACEAVEDSLFFNRKFDVIIAWGLLFLLPKEIQPIVIQKAANALRTGGRFLFTSPPQPIEWNDAMTDQHSESLGAEKYRKLLSLSGLALIAEFEDEGENHYYEAVKK